MTVIDQMAARSRDLSDAELISSVRGGDVSAYGDLFARHRDAATRLARQLVPGPDADDLVSEAFAKVLNVLLAGGGPDVAFRAYLLTAVRRLHVDKIRATTRATPTDDLTPFEDPEPATDTVIAGFEGGAAAKAFASLPERWQLVLWHLEVEGAKPADVAPLLGMTPNSVSALAYRAREGLRQAYLQMHTGDLVDPDCRWTHAKLGAYVRKGLSRRDVQKVESHLDGCRKCTAMYLELDEVNASLAALLGPLVLGTAAAGYLTATGATGAGAATGILAFLDRAKDVVLANAQAAAAVGAAAGVAGVATVAVALSHGGGHATASPPRPSVTGGLADPSTATPSPTPKRKHHLRVVAPPVALPTTPSALPTQPVASDTPDAKPKPQEPPSTPVVEPPTVPPISTVADVSVRTTFSLRPLGILTPRQSGLLGNLNVTTRGVPAGQRASITVHVVGGTMTQKGSGCKPAGSTATCTVGPGTTTLVFKVHGVPISATARITAPSGWTDPLLSNNFDSVLLGILSN
ncbi:MAG TPA: sigma-70 family RNA polymerase sigma factor [Marmoricola sp.]|nr:sigma-70 family RNA polymerase sigma factor [Marmoricola sp.]